MDASSEPEIRLHAFVGGQVQGVGFRMFVQEQAVRFGLTGWVRNRWDGRVEVQAEGEKAVLDQFLEQLRRGPRSAYVSDLHFDWLPVTSEFQHFIVRRTE